MPRLLGKASIWVALLFVAGVAGAQDQELRDPLPQIQFSPWREIGVSGPVVEYQVSFPSPVVSTHEVNNVVPLRIFLPAEREGPVPMVVILHYWGARDLRVERSLADALARRKIGTAIVTLPYHLTRTPMGTRSGELAIQPDPDSLLGMMRQSTLDARRAIDFLQTRAEIDNSRMGVAGTSLGALVAALINGVEPRLQKAAFVLGGVDLAEIMWNSSRVVSAREALRRRGYTRERLRDEIASVEPINYLPARKDDSAFVIAGRFDTVIPARSSEQLMGAFTAPKTLWLDTGHYGGIFVRQRILKEVANYFETEFSGKVYVPPRRIFAPTVRVVGGINSATGFDLGVGVDLWKPHENSIMGIGIITPRGPQLFLGKQISTGLSLGVTASPRKIGVGLLWSTVL